MPLSVSQIPHIITSYLDNPQVTHFHTISEALSLISNQNQSQAPKPSRGKKLENLSILNAYLKQKPMNGVSIPHLFAIDSSIERLFAQDLPQISTEWQKLEALYQKTPNREQFWKLAEPTLKAIQAEIIASFSKEGITDRLFTQSDLEQLQQLKAQDATVIDRSNSDEDAGSEDAAVNAGGNESIGGVQPEPKEVTSATARVVASYFSMTSLKNRSLFGSPFQKLPSLSAIIMQQVIEMPGSIPVSGVMMTNKPTFVDSKRMRITTLNAAYGFGKGVVENLVTTDSANIIRSAVDPAKLDIYYENRLKRERLVCDGTDVVRKPNAPDSQLIHALTPKQLERLYSLGQEIENCFGRPMDVEFVVQDDIIYVVQVRDIKAKSATAPSFLDTPEKGLSCETIVAGNSEVMVFRDPSELLITVNLEEAEKAFQPQKHRTVISASKDAEDSHFAINFASMRPAAIPCFYMNEEALQALKEHLGQSLVLCPQTGRILIGSNEGCIRQGWFSHPTGLKTSLLGVALKPYASDKPSSLDAFRELKLGNPRRGLQELDTHLHTSLNHILKNVTYKKEYFYVMASRIEKAAQKIFKEIQTCIDHPESYSRLEMLFHTRMLENLFYQSQSKNELTLGSHSLQSLEKERASYRYAEAFIAKNPGHPNSDLVTFASSYPSEELVSLWCSFLEKAPPSEKLHEILTILQENDLLHTWLLCCFVPTFRASQNAEECLTKLEASFTETDRLFIAETIETKQRVEAIQGRLEKVSSKKEIESTWNDLQELTRNLKHPSENASPLSIMAASSTYIELIQAYNASVQRIRTCAFLTKHEIEQLVEMRTRAFLELLGTWADGPLPYLSRIKGILSNRAHVESPLKHEIDIHDSFDVANWIMPESIPKAAIQRWDQLLTCIHQNLLHAVSQHLSSRLNPDRQNSSLPLPPLLDQFSKQLQANPGFERARLLGLRVEEKGIGLRWNLPLQAHSMEVDAFYNWRLQKLILTVKVQGWMTARGVVMRDYAYMAGEVEKIATPVKPMQSDELEICRFTWMLDDAEKINRILGHLNMVGRASYCKQGLNREMVKTIYKELHQINPELTDDRLLEIVLRDSEAQVRCPSLFVEDAIKDFLKHIDALPPQRKEKAIAQSITWQKKQLLAGESNGTFVFPILNYLSKQECFALIQEIAANPKVQSSKLLSLIDIDAPEQQEKVQAITQWIIEKLDAKDPTVLKFLGAALPFMERIGGNIYSLLGSILRSALSASDRENVFDLLWIYNGAHPESDALLTAMLCKLPCRDCSDRDILLMLTQFKYSKTYTEEMKAFAAELWQQIAIKPDDSLDEYPYMLLNDCFRSCPLEFSDLKMAAALRIFIRQINKGNLNRIFQYLSLVDATDRAEAMRHLVNYFRIHNNPSAADRENIEHYQVLIQEEALRQINQLLNAAEEKKS